ncbi:MAG: hypothetical protein NVS2B14_00280 [Chamaesiphon sp.]
MSKSIEIPAPRFDQYQFVTLYWNDEVRATKVVRRWYDFDDGYWWYVLNGDDRFYPGSVLEEREG